MRTVLQILSWIALAGSLAPSLLFFLDRMDAEPMKLTTLIATVVWFVMTPLWMGRQAPGRDTATDC